MVILPEMEAKLAPNNELPVDGPTLPQVISPAPGGQPDINPSFSASWVAAQVPNPR